MKYNVIMTRETDNFVTLSQRVDISNKFNADIFISIHNNSFSNSNVKGIETYYLNGSKKSPELAYHMHNCLLADPDLYNANRGVKKAKFYVLKYTNAKAVLLELAFISNYDDKKILLNKYYKFANEIAWGIKTYLPNGGRVCIDPGHGGYDPGAINGSSYEKNICLKIAQIVKYKLQNT